MEPTYKISHTPPPCYPAARDKFKVNFFRDGVVFTYGDTIHFFRGNLEEDVLVHEKVHIKQHAAYPGGPAAWWHEYIHNPDFRLSQELEAYRAQWQWAKENFKKNTLPHHLNFYAKSLVILYKLPDMDMDKAVELIKA